MADPILDPSAPGIAAPLLAAQRAQAAQVAGLPAPVIAMPNFGGGPPAVSAPSLHPTAISPVLTDQDNLNALRSSPTGVSQIHNPFLRVPAEVGDALFSRLIPGLASAVPGTTARHDLLVHQAENRLAFDQKQAQEQAQQAQTEANTNYLEQRPEIEQNKLDQKNDAAHEKNVVALAKNGQKYDENGQIIDDPTSEAYQSRKVMDDVRQSQQDVRQAELELKQAAADPNSPQYKLAVAKLEVSRANAAAAGTRAQAYMGNYLKGAYNTGLHGDVLPGAPQITDDAGNVTTVGATNAPQAVKAQANAAQFGDVGGALDNLEAKARALVASGGRLNSPGVVYALQHAGSGTPSQILQSLDKANLTPQERDYVISNLAAHENVQALRKSAGGTATDTAVAKLDALLPNGSTPDIDYLLNQTGQIRQTAARLGKGVTTVKGGLKVDTGAANPTGESLGATTKPDGVYEMNGKQYRVKGGQVYAH